MQRIVITGPESTGKTTLAKQLAAHFKTSFVPEYARYYLSNLGRPYQEDDLLEIAKGQLEWQNDPQYHGPTVQICDTGFLVLKIWSEYKYGQCHPWILQQYYDHQPDLYLLCDIDLPWQFDPLRENPNERVTLMNIYRKELENSGCQFVEISGQEEERFIQARISVGVVQNNSDANPPFFS